jgi:hypothetical protein
MNREEWLNQAVHRLRADFQEQAECELPEKIRVTCGWPSKGGRGKKNRTTGECWPCKSSEDHHFEIFISPMESNPLNVLGILVHELVHTATPGEGHKKPFRDVAIAVGLEGKMTATTSSEMLLVRLTLLKDQLGLYPHAAINPNSKTTQSTRMLKIECPACGWMARTSQKWMDLGLPVCACGEQMVDPDAD